MKTSLALCCLCLAAGVILGHINGKHVAASNFIDNCETTRVVVFHDREVDARRNFHCFEIAMPERRKVPPEPPEPVRMI